MTGFAGAWLAYSGLESLGQLAPALREPREKVIRVAAALVVGSVLLTVPLFTALAVEAARTSRIAPQGALLAPVALKYGGTGLLTALSLTGAGLLLVAANLAFIGCYNVFKTVGEHGYLPAALSKRNRRYGTPTRRDHRHHRGGGGDHHFHPGGSAAPGEDLRVRPARGRTRSRRSAWTCCAGARGSAGSLSSAVWSPRWRWSSPG